MSYICNEWNLTFTNYSLKDFAYPGGPEIWEELDFAGYIKIFAYVIIILGGLLGNISVILTVALNRSMRTTINFYVANLAVADGMICIICMLPEAIKVLTVDIYIFGAFMCKFNPFTQMTCLTCSVLTLSAISCDRFMAIMFPLHVRITKQRTSVVITIVWIASIIVSTPFIVVKYHHFNEYRDYSEPQCLEQWPHEYYYDETMQRCRKYERLRAIYHVVVSFALFFMPVLIMITSYSLILWRLWMVEVPGEQHASNVNAHTRSRKKVNKMVFAVLVSFMICWTPLQVVILYGIFGHDRIKHGNLPDWFTSLEWFSYYFAYANSFVNPIIYGGFNKDFRDGFCILIRCGYQNNRLERTARSRMTFATGTILRTSRNVSKTVNGVHKSASQKSTIEMKLALPISDGDASPTAKDIRVSITEKLN